MKVTCYDHLYISHNLKKKKDRLLQRVQKRKHLSSFYLIILSQGTKNQLEFFPAVLLKQPAFDRKSFFLVGIAADYDEAVFLVEQITRDTLREKGNADIRNYIRETQKLQES